jgi:hypothetical protein
MDRQTRRSLEGEIAKRVLSPDDLRLFEAIRRGKTMSGYALLHRKYEGENGVREAYERAQAQVHAAINGGARAAPERPLDAQLLPDEDEDTHSGVPVRSVPAGTIGEAGARPTSSPSATPPKAGRPPSSAPERLPAVSDSPAAAPKPSPRDLGRQRQERVLVLLRANGEMGTMEIARALDIPSGSIGVLRTMERRGQLRSRKEGVRVLYTLADAEPQEREPAPAPSTAVEPAETHEYDLPDHPALAAEDEPLPMPPPFAGGVRGEPAEAMVHAGQFALVTRYCTVLIDRLAQLEVPHTSAPHLMDRIERALGLSANGRAEQAHGAVGDGEPGERAGV